MLCPACGQAISDEAVVCSYCGQSVAGGPPKTQPTFAGELPAPTYSEFTSKKIAAGICGILLGQFGVHKFILGQTKPALIMLLVTICSCYILGFPMHIVGAIEGIMYLTKSDQEFYQMYGVQKKEWF